MAKRRGLQVSAMCRTLTGSEVMKDKLTQLYQLSQQREHENMIALCRGPKGKLYTGPYSVSHEKWEEGLWDYSEMISPKDNPCRVSGGKMIGTVHTHPKGDPNFSNADLMTMDDRERTGCILYRKGNDLRLRCIDLRQPLKQAPPILCDVPGDDCDPTIMMMSFTQPCDISVGKGRVSRWRAPWKTY